MEDIVIYTKRRYLIAMAAGSLLLVGACVYPLVYGFDISGRDSLGRFFKLITPEIFYVGAPVFSLAFIYICYRLLKPTPSVIINQEGVFENASVFGAGLIRWEEIESMFIYQVMNNAFLGIVPVDLDAILARQPPIKRFLFKMNKGMAQAPFAISEGGLPMSVEELLSRIVSYREALWRDRAEEPVH
ncbi:MAG TPA: STM3941 family protein [Pyrinomonadaceae bacterium]